MPEQEELAVSKIAYVILVWQLERVLHIKFPGEVSRAQEAGFVSCTTYTCMSMVQVAQYRYSTTVHSLSSPFIYRDTMSS